MFSSLDRHNSPASLIDNIAKCITVTEPALIKPLDREHRERFVRAIPALTEGVEYLPQVGPHEPVSNMVRSKKSITLSNFTH